MGKTIVIVVSPLGLGHVTRQIALKNTLLRMDKDLSIRFVCTEEQKKIAHTSILTDDRVIVEQIPMVPKITMNNWLEMDIGSTIDSFKRSWEFDTQIRDDTEWGRILFGADLVINDIECVHNPIATKMKIPIINISNFTWSDILYNIGERELAQVYVDWERLANHHLRLPMSTPCRGMDNPIDVGLLAREINWEIVDDIKQISSNQKVFFSLSRDTWDYNYSKIFEKLNQKGFTVITSSQFALENLSIISYDKTAEVQNYVAAADVVVGKVGYGLCSEVLAAGKPFLHYTRSQFAEDKALSNGIVTRDQGIALDVYSTPEVLLTQIIKYSSKNFDKLDLANEAITKRILDILDETKGRIN